MRKKSIDISAFFAEEIEPSLQNVALEDLQVASGKKGKLTVDLSLPKNCRLNPDATLNYKVTQLTGSAIAIAEQTGRLKPRSPLLIPFRAGKAGSKSDLRLAIDVHYCQEGDKDNCHVKSLRLKAHVRSIDNAKDPHILCSINAKDR